MPKEDYLVKYLQKLSKVLAAMLGFREKGLPGDALQLVNETYTELLDIDLMDIDAMSKDEFIDKIQNINLTPSFLELLAKITKEATENFKELGDTERTVSFAEKALALFHFLNEKDKTYSFERENLISELKIYLS